MIKVGFVTTPLTGGHAARGIGFYTRNLLAGLKSQARQSQFEILEIDNCLEIVNCKLDILHYPFFDLFYSTLPWRHPTKVVVTIHDVIPLEFPDHYPPGLRGWFNLQRQKLALAGVDRVLAYSEASVRGIHKFLGVPHAKIRLVYLAAASRFRPVTNRKHLVAVAKKYHLPDRFVLYVGDINYNKNLSSMVRACRLLKTSLVIVGKHAAEIASLDLSHPELSHLKDLDLDSTLRLGFVSDADLVAIYNLATICCLPSFAEGFGLSVLEAMACGTPVACSATYSLPEIAGEAAVYFDPYNTDDVTRVLKSLLSDPVLCRRLAQAGPIQAARFSWAATAEGTLQVYRELYAT